MPADLFSNPALLLTLLFAAALAVHLLLELWLAARQLRHVVQHRGAVPPAFAGHVSLRAHQRAADYTVDAVRLGMLENTFSAVVLLGWTLLGGLDALNQALQAWLGQGFVQQLTLLLAFGVISGLLGLPWGLYKTFVIEQRHGFNRMTARLWLADGLRALLVAALLGVPLAAAVLWLMQVAGNSWWLWAWALWMGFNLLMMWLFPTVIAPLFNQFKPLEDEALKTRILALMDKSGFRAQGLFVMDGSRRSAHANAYFTGLGSAKRVVFFDTLLAKLNAGEIEAVLAHELGHFRNHHVTKRLLSFFVLSLAGFALLGWLLHQPWFFAGLGVMPSLLDAGGLAPVSANSALALILFSMLVSVFGGLLQPLWSQLSRKHEFEADAYAATHASGGDLAAALLKLYEDNASTLTPDPLYARFHYSHPPAAERLARLPGALGAQGHAGGGGAAAPAGA
ncbi:M48 family peptidase [Corticibacter populi]|uniref:M48 family peptidase n=1 Tax=Corticibacter populi TaxID=1550736 RepID=A0A3M6QKA0_9BURK|nr:M48 family metallopeptidase [Corticibacter populi]RMX03524.1 M48 family peptidase [Corticibacter populi]RZS29972.1 STE24 endopeptidase [Corticibacter populi]